MISIKDSGIKSQSPLLSLSHTWVLGFQQLSHKKRQYNFDLAFLESSFSVWLYSQSIQVSEKPKPQDNLCIGVPRWRHHWTKQDPVELQGTRKPFYRNETLSKWKISAFFIPEGHSLLTRETHQAETMWCQFNRVQALHTSWFLSTTLLLTIAIELLTRSLQVGTHCFSGMSLLCPPLPGKVIKQLFSTSPKMLSLRFD